MSSAAITSSGERPSSMRIVHTARARRSMVSRIWAMSWATSRRSTCSLNRRPAVGDRFGGRRAGAVGGRDELVEGRGGVAARAAQLHLALVDDDLAQEGTWVADRLAVALLHPRGRGRDLEDVAEGITPPRPPSPSGRASVTNS